MWFKKKKKEGDLLEALESLVERHSNDAAEILDAARQALAEGDLIAADVLCSTAIVSDNTVPDGYILRAKVYLQRGFFKRAQFDAEDALKRDPENARAFCLMGEALHMLEDYDGASEAFAKAVALAPTDTYCLSAWGQAATYCNDLDTALDCYEKAAVLEPESSYWLYCIGCVRNRMEDWEAAEEQLSIAIERDGASPEYFVQRALSYLRTDRLGLAMADYLKVEELDPTLPNLQAAISKVAFLLEDFDLALEKCEQAITAGDETWENYHNRALIKSRLGMLEEAIEDFSKSIEIRPSSETYYQRARVYSELGDLDSSLRDINMVISFDPMASHPYQARAALYRDLKQDALAEEDEARALQFSQAN